MSRHYQFFVIDALTSVTVTVIVPSGQRYSVYK